MGPSSGDRSPIAKQNDQPHIEMSAGAVVDIALIRQGGLVRQHNSLHPRHLIVLVHALRLDNTQWVPFLNLAKDDPTFAACDFYLYGYPRGFRQKSSIEDIAGVLANNIDVRVGRNGSEYDRVTLIGYSVGGLIVRSAYLQARQQQHPWFLKTQRIILMATPNRGLGGSGTSLLGRLRLSSERVFGGQLMRDTAKGSDFITRLRLDWVYAFRNHDIPSPEVIQLLGMQDRFVHRTDSNDVTIFGNAKLFMVRGTHTDLAQFSGPEDEKYLRLRRCCLDSISEEPGSEDPAPAPGTAPTLVVFELHGIRDYGHWLSKFETTIKSIDSNARVIRPGYGYFSVLDFIIPWIRRRRISWFCDCYTQEVASLATLDDVSFFFVGHSYGTYLLAECLRRFQQMRFKRAYLVGSVIPREFDWRTLIVTRGQLEGLRNDCCSLDWPVGICCRILSQIGFRDIGEAGFRGFQVGIPNVVDYLYVPGHHSITLIEPSGRLSAANYLLQNDNAAPTLVPPVRWMSFASQWALPLVVSCLIGMIAVIHFVAQSVNLDSHLAIAAMLVLVALVLTYL